MGTHATSRQCDHTGERARSQTSALAAAVLLVTVAACDVVPRDSTGAFDRALAAGELRVGVAENAPWVVAENGRILGIEIDVLERWASELGIGLRLEPGPEAELIERLHARDLDVVAAGLVRDSPYRAEVALTRPYLVSALDVWAAPGATPEPKARVLAVTPGESRLLYELDRFLIAHRVDWQRRASAR